MIAAPPAFPMMVKSIRESPWLHARRQSSDRTVSATLPSLYSVYYSCSCFFLPHASSLSFFYKQSALGWAGSMVRVQVNRRLPTWGNSMYLSKQCRVKPGATCPIGSNFSLLCVCTAFRTSYCCSSPHKYLFISPFALIDYHFHESRDWPLFIFVL